MVIFLLHKVNGRITNYRVGNKSQTPRECLIEFQGINSSALAGQILGQKVAWKSGKKLFVGRVKGIHGRNGMVIVRFLHGVPGQAIGTIVELL
jgi:large subunit ribosomal protein L35Ae